MKIKGVVVRVVKGNKAGVVIHAPDEFKVRKACAALLKKAHSLRLHSITLPPLGVDKGFPAVAAAKIMSQEILRHIKDDETSLKKITLVAKTGEEFRIFHKQVNSYLKHILDVLSQGPFVTVDAVIEVKGGVVLVKRSNPPFGWALPGGFVDYGESLEEAVAREAEEETGLKVEDLRQMHTYSNPSRDPRFHTISTVFICQAKGKPRGGSDALQAKVFKPQEWRKLKIAFDHRRVLRDYLRAPKYLIQRSLCERSEQGRRD